jgi:hypothetical protein
MLRRYFNEDDFQDEYRDDDDDHNLDPSLGNEEGEFIHYIGKDELLNSIQDMEMFEMNFNARILEMAIELSQKSWLWRFRSIKKKTEIVNKAYQLLSVILTPNELSFETSDDETDDE